ncbi:hypothetical protein NQZ79_g4660 [Umbelopsis isabellina]|nr:hypothetical protein NQZ79_g4660 [Umbelopsis isabellina]
MSRQKAQESLPEIENLVHAVAGIQHVEEAYLQKKLDYKVLAYTLPPIEKRLNDAKAKTVISKNGVWLGLWLKMMCDLKRQTIAAEKGLQKAKDLEKEAQSEVDAVNIKLKDIEQDNEKNAIDHRSLIKYREELDSLFEPIFAGQKYPTEENLSLRLNELQEEKAAIDKDIEATSHVLELLKTVDFSLMEGIVDARESSKQGGGGKIFFPDGAFNALKEARQLLPELPSIVPPETYTKSADETGAYYTPMQRYLWDVKDKVAELVPWCQQRTLENIRKLQALEMQIGSKTDERNLERRRLLREVILSA